MFPSSSAIRNSTRFLHWDPIAEREQHQISLTGSVVITSPYTTTRHQILTATNCRQILVLRSSREEDFFFSSFVNYPELVILVNTTVQTKVEVVKFLTSNPFFYSKLFDSLETNLFGTTPQSPLSTSLILSRQIISHCQQPVNKNAFPRWNKWFLPQYAACKWKCFPPQYVS